MSHSQVADMGNHCADGCVHVTHSAVARRGVFIVNRVILRFLTQTSLPGGSSSRSLLCVVCTSETAFLPEQDFHFPQSHVFTDL